MECLIWLTEVAFKFVQAKRDCKKFQEDIAEVSNDFVPHIDYQWEFLEDHLMQI